MLLSLIHRAIARFRRSAGRPRRILRRLSSSVVAECLEQRVLLSALTEGYLPAAASTTFDLTASVCTRPSIPDDLVELPGFGTMARDPVQLPSGRTEFSSFSQFGTLLATGNTELNNTPATAITLPGGCGDQITVFPLVDIPVTIDGGAPAFPTGGSGDELSFDVSQFTSRTFTSNSQGTGSLADGAFGTIAWSEIESVTTPAFPVTGGNSHVNGSGNINRSGIRDVTITFSQAVTVNDATALNLFNHTTGQNIDLSAATLVNNGTSAVTWDLTGVTLADGRYTAELPSAGTSPDLTVTHTIKFDKLYGDVNGDGTVSFSDYTAVQADFGAGFAANTNQFRPGDANGDGEVSFLDYTAVQSAFGGSLAALELDFGDADDTSGFPTTFLNNGARHVITGNNLFLGSTRDAEVDGQSSVDATADGADEDGVVFGDLDAGSTASVTVTASVPSTAVLSGWLDFNQDGDWDDAGEQVFADQSITDGTNNLTIAVPAGAAPGTAFARFRLTETAGYSWAGLASDGEVEDYLVSITSTPAPRIVLGPSDNIALDQPRVDVLLTEDTFAAAVDDFESGDFSGGRDQWQSGAWSVSGDASVQTGVPHAGNFYARLKGTGAVQRTVDTTGLTGLRLQFWSQISSFAVGDQAHVDVSSDGTNWTTLKTYGNSHNVNRYHMFDVPVPSSGNTLFIRFAGVMSTPDATWNVDDISVINAPVFLGSEQIGPFEFNEFLLETGSSSILTMGSAVTEMVDGPYVYQTEGEFFEQGIAGLSIFDIGAPYSLYFAANGNDYEPRAPLLNTRVLSKSFVDFSPFGPWGIGGMPLMEGRVVTLDYSGWSGGLVNNLSNLLMMTSFSDTVPQAENSVLTGPNRYSVALDNRLTFDPEHGILEGEHPPIWADIPFMTATVHANGIDQSGNFQLDTGAQWSFLSSELGFNLNLDSNNDGVLGPNDDNYVNTFTVSEAGGTINAHMFFIDEVRLPTEQGVELVWTDLSWLIVDTETPEDQPSVDGVIGSDLLTSGWFNTVFAGGPDGYIQQTHFDFRDWSAGTGTMYLDITSNESAAETIGTAFVPIAPSQYSSSDSLMQQLTSQLTRVPRTNWSDLFDSRNIAANNQSRAAAHQHRSHLPPETFDTFASELETSIVARTISQRIVEARQGAVGASEDLSVRVWQSNTLGSPGNTRSSAAAEQLSGRTGSESRSLYQSVLTSRYSERTLTLEGSAPVRTGTGSSADDATEDQWLDFVSHDVGPAKRRD